MDAGLEQHAGFRLAAALERIVDALEHAIGADVGEKAEPAAVDAEHRDRACGRQPGRLEHRAVAAHRHQQVGALREIGLRYEADWQPAELDPEVRRRADVPTPLEQVRRESEHGLAHPRIGGAAREGDVRVVDVAGVHGCPAF
jgi:hypothetical protein